MDTPIIENLFEKVCAADACFWATEMRIKLQAGDIFSLVNHEYMLKPMQSRARRKCAMKATGMGWSEGMGILPTIHDLIYGRFKQGALYLFPTNVGVQDFSKSRFDTLFTNNREAIGKFVKSGSKGTDTVKLKKIGNSFLYLRGATLDPEDEGLGGKTSTGLSSIQVDSVTFDEIRLMSQETIAKALGRMGHSLIQQEVYIANPGGEDEDIDIIFKSSDQQYWFRKCPACGERTCAELEFPQCVKIYVDADERRRAGKHTGYIACKKCGKPVPMWNGTGSAEWISQKPSNTDMEGYNIGHLSSVFYDPAAILARFNDPPQGNLGDVYRLDLGKPYSSSEDKLQKHVVLASCGRDVMPESHSGPCAMGVDVGIIKHVVIGIKTGKENCEIIRVAQVKSFDDIHDLARRYGVKSEVVDIRPYEDEARQHQKIEKSYGNKVWLCQYVDSPLEEADFNENNGVVKTYRTGIFDKTHRMLTKGDIRLPRQCPAVEEFAQQCCNCAKHKEEKQGSGTIYRYQKTGDQKQGEHYRHALNYFILAASGHRIKSVSPYGQKNLQKFALHETVKI